MPNKVDAVLLATATTLMWRGVDRGADLLGIESSSCGTNEPILGCSSTPAGRCGLQPCGLVAVAEAPQVSHAVHKEDDSMIVNSLKLARVRNRVPRLARLVALTGVALALAVQGHAQDLSL